MPTQPYYFKVSSRIHASYESRFEYGNLAPVKLYPSLLQRHLLRHHSSCHIHPISSAALVSNALLLWPWNLLHVTLSLLKPSPIPSLMRGTLI